MSLFKKISLAFLLSLLCSFLITSKLFAQTFSQLGLDIDGAIQGDQSGGAVSLSSDGTVLAIGARFNDSNGGISGQVRIYTWNGSAWVQRGADIIGEAAGDISGHSVSLSSDGSVVAIGAPYNDGTGANAGHVRVFAWDGTSWVQQGSDIDGEAAGDYLGWSVSLSSDASVVAIGAFANDGNGAGAGHVRVYAWNGTNWVLRGNDIDGEAAGDIAGASVSLSSDGLVLAIGSPGNGNNGTFSGHVRIFRWNGVAWVQRGTDIEGEAERDESGFSVSLSADGSVVAIGAIGNDGNGSNAGHVRVYEWNGTAWVPRGNDIDGEAAEDWSGESVSLSSDGTVVAIGASRNDGSGVDAGHTRIYIWNGSAWVKLGADIDGEFAGDKSGESISLSPDGSVVAIGAKFNSVIGIYTGHVRIYSLALAPAIHNLDTEIVTWPGVGNTVVIDADANAFLTDANFEVLNNGNGNWSGSTLTVQRTGTTLSSDLFDFTTGGALFTVSGTNLQSGGQTFATFSNSSGVQTINFTSSGTIATTALVNDVIRQISYQNDTPAGDALLRFTLSDGSGNADATAEVTVSSDFIYITNSTDDATVDLSDGVSFSEAVAIAGADATGNQTLVFNTTLASTSLSISPITLAESLTFDTNVANGITLSGGTITMATGTTQTFTNGSGDNTTISSIFAGDGAIAKAGAGTLILSGTNSYTGVSTISEGTLQIGNGGTIGSIGLGEIINNGIFLINRSNDLAIGININSTGSITGTGSLVKKGVGRLTLSGSNSTFSGGTSILEGSIRLGNSSGGLPSPVLGTGLVSISSGATLDVNGHAFANDISLSGSGVSTTGALYNSDSNAPVLSGTITLAGASTFTSNGCFTFSGNIDGAYNLEITCNDQTFTQSGVLGGIASPTLLTIGVGSGSLNLNSAIHVAGPISLNGGTIEINAPVSAINGNLHIVSSSSVIDGASGYLIANTLTLNGAGTVTLDNPLNDVNGMEAGLSTQYVAALTFVDKDDLQIGLSDPVAVYSSGEISIATLEGNLLLDKFLLTTSASSNAIRLFAGRDKPAGTITGGDVLFGPDGDMQSGLGSIVKIYSGSMAASTGLSQWVGAGNERFGIDATTTTFDPALTSNRAYALYREFDFLVWLGLSNSNIMDGTNWQEGIAPTSGTAISVGALAPGAHYPVINSDLELGEVSIAANANITINPGYGLKISSGKNVNIAAGGKLILKSDAGGTAYIESLAGGSAITGTVVQERHVMGSNRSFRFMGHPFTTAIPLSALGDKIDITGEGTGFTPTATNNPSAFYYDPSTGDGDANEDGGWKAFTAITDDWNRHQGIRVLVRGSKGQADSFLDTEYTPDPVTFEWEGTVNTGPQNIDLDYHNLGGLISDFNLIGNPYPAAIDLKAITRSASVGSSFYIWQPRESVSGIAGRGGSYLTEPFATGSASYELPTGGAFFVRAGAAGQSLTIEEDDKLNTNEPLQSAAGSTLRMDAAISSKYGSNSLQLVLESQSTNGTEPEWWDRILLFFDGNAQADSKDYMDAGKLANPDVNFFSLSEDGYALAIDTRAWEEAEEAAIIPIWIMSPVRTYTIRIPDYDLEAGHNLILYDRFTEESISLSKGESYSFEVTEDPKSRDHRFDLIMGGEVVTSLQNLQNELQVVLMPNPAQQQVAITFQRKDQWEATEIRIMDMQGRVLEQQSILPEEEARIDYELGSLGKGIYLVEVRQGMSREVKRLIVK